MAKRLVLPQLLKTVPRGMSFDSLVLAYFEWLEDRYGAQKYRKSDSLFLPVFPIETINAMQSHLAVQPLAGLVEAWFGDITPKRRWRDMLSRPAPGRPILPFCKCGGDGSVIALWMPEQDIRRYVFMGSEGEAFTLAEDPVSFIILLTMGYSNIEGRDSLQYSPDLQRDHPGVIPVRDWVLRRLDVKYPTTAEELLPYFEVDPFTIYAAGT